jgi:dTDP-4-dehydrorhamnose reductase
MKILVLGSKGQLGSCLHDQLLSTCHEVIFTSREQIDIINFDSTRVKILTIAPDVVINATAYTSVDMAEENQKVADLINHLAVKNISEVCFQAGFWLFHISTDYVFNGLSNTAYKENDETCPQGIYGNTKLKGEKAISASGCKHVIIRTAWIFSEYGNNFLKTMLNIGSDLNEINVINDQIGCPTYAKDIAMTIVTILDQLNSLEKFNLYHYCGDTPCSWYDFSLEIFKEAKTFGLNVPILVHPINSAAYPTLAKRPAFSVLDCSNIVTKFGVVASDWRVGIRRAIKEIIMEAT